MKIIVIYEIERCFYWYNIVIENLFIFFFRVIMIYVSVFKSNRDVFGISDILIRLFVGLEDKKDLLDDLD